MGRAISEPWSLAALLGPKSVETFCAEHWAKQPLHVQRDQPAFFRGLITLADIERCLFADGALELHDINAVEDEWDRPPNPPASVSELYERIAAGKQLRIRRLEAQLPQSSPVVQLMRAIERELRHPKSTLTCYVSGPNGKSLGPHHDRVEIFSLQISGHKRWQLFDKLETDKDRVYRRDELGSPTRELTMRPGDVLYVPRGTIHQVFCEEPSFSLAIAFAPVMWSSLLELLARSLAATPAFIAPLPAGGELEGPRMTDALRARRAQLHEAIDAIDDAVLREWLGLRRMVGATLSADEHLPDVFRASTLQAETRLELRPGLDALLTRDAREVVLTMPGGFALRMAAAAEPALAQILGSRAPFAVAAIHDGLSSAAKLALARRLIACGVLRFAQEQGA